MQAVILAGGLGTRMRPYTERAPKCLLPVHDRPFIDYQLDLLKAGGVREIVLCLGYLGEMVQAHVGDGSNRNMHITYSWDSDSSGGTAGALKHAESLLDETFFLTWGDSYVRVNHAEMFAVHRANASQPVVTMGVFRNENAYDSSNVEIEGDKVIRYVKGAPQLRLNYIDAGISVFDRRALEEIPSGQNAALDSFFSSWAERGQVGAYVVSERFYETGSWTGLAAFEKFIATGLESNS
jgi:N-acetyl-alpha-D-muramate 1-phosphate uridylyltransferase